MVSLCWGNGQACCTGRQVRIYRVVLLPYLPLPWVQVTSDPAVCHVSRLIYSYLSLSNRRAAFALACSSAFLVPLWTLFRSPRVEHYSLAPAFLKHIECTLVIQLHCVIILFLYVITHLHDKLPKGRDVTGFHLTTPITYHSGRS